MEKNYYEILEIDKNASPEIIKKAYSTLAKKYHPDLQPDDKKREAEATFKLINEAYETLSDEAKKKEYDKTIVTSTVSQEDYNAIYQENEQLKSIINQLQKQPIQQNNSNNINNNITQQNVEPKYQDAPDPNYYKDYEKNIKQAYEQAYYDAYIQDLKNRGYKIRYKKTFKDHLKNLIALLLTVFILWILWQLPFVQKLIKDSILFPFNF